MKIPMFQVDAFTNSVFCGNPAAVCVLDHWLEDKVLQAIAAENNLSETAFVVAKKDRYHLRWFTPVSEVDLCGHATLATAHILFRYFQIHQKRLIFETLSGELYVQAADSGYSMNFPSWKPKPCKVPDTLLQALNPKPSVVLKTRDYVCVYEREAQIVQQIPEMDLLKTLDVTGIIVTAPGDEVDFVSRFFAPKEGIPEDPVTGSAHSSLIPYWSEHLSKKEMIAKQLSKRGGDLLCKDLGGRVEIMGEAIVFFHGEIYLKDF